jgi:hypothetical protein
MKIFSVLFFMRERERERESEYWYRQIIVEKVKEKENN